MAKRLIPGNEKAPLTGDNDALVAFDGYKRGFETPTAKKHEKSDAIKGVSAVQAHLVNIGVAKYEAQEYEKAFLSFQASLQAHDILKANSQKSVLEDPEQYDNQMYITAISAHQAKRNADAMKYYTDLHSKGNAKAVVYEGLYAVKLESGDEASATKILEEGRAKYPDDSGLRFSEINAFLKKGRLNDLTDRLKQAITTEPTNISLYVTLGNVYDNLYQSMSKEKNDAKAAEYFDEAKKYYTQAAQRDPNNVDANYSLGSLYYIKAAVLSQEMNNAHDSSSAGIRKLEALKNEVMGLFNQSLPHFQKAESLGPNDINTLIALKEIYARKVNDELSLEFKNRLETVRYGGKNTTSYFKK